MDTTREIDRRAQDIFRMTLPSSWLIREQHPDIYVDYYVETNCGPEPSGVVFGVQLKGSKSPNYSRKFIKYSIKTKHLKYYLDKVKQPFFLIIIDVTRRKGYWCFIQEWAREELGNKNWRNQTKITVNIPVDNSLSDCGKFTRKITEADSYMRELWPSSIGAAIKHEKRSLEALDPRIGIDIAHHSGVTKCILEPKENIKFDIQLKNSPSLQEKFADLRDHGREISVEMHEVVGVSGSPLLEKVFEDKKEGKLSIAHGKKIEPTLTLSTVDSKKNKRTLLHSVTGELFGGEREIHFEGGLKESPLMLKFSIPVLSLDNSNPLKMQIMFDDTPWANQPVLMLNFFNSLKSFFECLLEDQSIEIVCEVQGNHIFTARSQGNIPLCFVQQVVKFLQVLEKFRYIAREHGINPQYPQNKCISNDEIDTILILHKLIVEGEYRQKGVGVTFKVALLPNDNFRDILNETDEMGISGTLAWEKVDVKFVLLGEEFDIALLRYTLTNPILVTDKAALLAKLEQNHESSIDIVWSGGPDSELIISKS